MFDDTFYSARSSFSHGDKSQSNQTLYTTASHTFEETRVKTEEVDTSSHSTLYTTAYSTCEEAEETLADAKAPVGGAGVLKVSEVSDESVIILPTPPKEVIEISDSSPTEKVTD